MRRPAADLSIGGVVVVLALVAVGCGSQTADDETTLSHEELIAQGDKLCLKFQLKRRELERQLSDPGRSRQPVDILVEGADASEELYDELQDLPAAPQDQRALETAIGGARVSIALVRQGARALESGDVRGATDLVQRAAPLTIQSNQAFQRFGFRYCGNED